MADSFVSCSMNVNVIDMAPQLMDTLDKDMADDILKYMTEYQVMVFHQGEKTGKTPGLTAQQLVETL
ncbi:MAG: hypothetical protein JXR61_04380 [Prolixibacteraceae bacterium]|nr:hypothetical protein [Prolixibacteraceae bacterium]